MFKLSAACCRQPEASPDLPLSAARTGSRDPGCPAPALEVLLAAEPYGPSARLAGLPDHGPAMRHPGPAETLAWEPGFLLRLLGSLRSASVRTHRYHPAHMQREQRYQEDHKN